jgi:hypothetical protein
MALLMECIVKQSLVCRSWMKSMHLIYYLNSPWCNRDIGHLLNYTFWVFAIYALPMYAVVRFWFCTFCSVALGLWLAC